MDDDRADAVLEQIRLAYIAHQEEDEMLCLALAEDRLTPDQKARLNHDAEESEIAACQIEGCLPFSDALVARIVADAEQSLTAKTPRSPRPWWNRWQTIVPGVLAAAAASVLAFVWLPPATNLPAYSLNISSGDRTWRSTPSAKASVPKLGPGSRLRMSARPEEPIATPLSVRAFLRLESQPELAPWIAWSPKFEQSDEGVLHISLHHGGDIPEHEGLARVVLVIGTPAALAVVGERPPAPATDLVVLRSRVELVR